MVFAVLVGEVSDGGCDAGTEEMLPLLKVALVDIVQELVVSAHINIRQGELIWHPELQGKKKKNKGSRTLMLPCYFREMPILLTQVSFLLAVQSVQSGTERRKKDINTNALFITENGALHKISP